MESPIPPSVDLNEQPTQPKQRKWLKRLAIGCGSVLTVTVLACVGIAVFVMLQQGRLLASAKEQRAEGNYAAAVENLETLIDEHSSSDEAEEAISLLPQVQIEWAEALRQESDFAGSLAKYDEVAAPDLAEQVAEGKHETRLAWGESLVADGDFAAAQEQVEQVLAETEAGTPQYDRAREALPAIYVGLAEQARDAGDVQTATQRLVYVLENYQTGAGREQALETFAGITEPLYSAAQQARSEGRYVDAEELLVALVNYAPESPETAQAQGEMPAMYLEWGQSLAAAEAFDDAVIIYQHFLDNYPDSELAAQAAAGLIDAEVGAVAASGEAGALPSPDATAGAGGDLALYDITNDTVCPIKVLMSGAQSQAVTLEPQVTQQVEVVPGNYSLVVQTDDDQELSRDCQDIIPFTNDTPFETGMIYYSSFYIETVEE